VDFPAPFAPISTLIPVNPSILPLLIPLKLLIEMGDINTLARAMTEEGPNKVRDDLSWARVLTADSALLQRTFTQGSYLFQENSW
jgi:hypothetical protein